MLRYVPDPVASAGQAPRRLLRGYPNQACQAIVVFLCSSLGRSSYAGLLKSSASKTLIRVTLFPRVRLLYGARESSPTISREREPPVRRYLDRGGKLAEHLGRRYRKSARGLSLFVAFSGRPTCNEIRHGSMGLGWRRNVPLTRHCLIGIPGTNLLLRAADEGRYEKSRARNIPRPECLYDVAASMRLALGRTPGSHL